MFGDEGNSNKAMKLILFGILAIVAAGIIYGQMFGIDHSHHGQTITTYTEISDLSYCKSGNYFEFDENIDGRKHHVLVGTGDFKPMFDVDPAAGQQSSATVHGHWEAGRILADGLEAHLPPGFPIAVLQAKDDTTRVCESIRESGLR